MDALILGDGPLGRAIAAAFLERGDRPVVLGRPPGDRHRAEDLAGAAIVVDASRGPAVAANVAAACQAGIRHLVIAATAWDEDRPRVARLLDEHDAAAVAAPNLALGMALFGRLVDAAMALFGSAPAFDPYLVEWHRRGKADRPSGTALALAGRIVSGHPRLSGAVAGPAGVSDPATVEVVGIRAGVNPGSHLVGFDAPGEAIELRHVARDRTAYAAGALAATDWLRAAPRAPGLHSFDEVVDELLALPREVVMAHG
jgi:4-hydroxy-tetrahydrodipicolinate reductase